MLNRTLNVLSLFDGIACGLIALQRCRIYNINYYASEIDPAALIVAKMRNPNIIHVGNVIKLKPEDFKHIDLIIGGSPCQSMSKMGKGQGITTKDGTVIKTLKQYMVIKNRTEKRGLRWEDVFNTSALYWEFVRLYEGIKVYNPKLLFLLENVSNKKWETIINNSIGRKPVFINSSYFSAQNRERNYWTNLPCTTPIIDKGITIQDVIPEAFIAAGIRGRKINPDDKKYTQCLTFRKDMKSNCVVTTPHMTNKYISYDAELCTITPEHAEVLQTIDPGYTDVPGITRTQRYAMIGNAWTIDVITIFFENIPLALHVSHEDRVKF